MPHQYHKYYLWVNILFTFLIIFFVFIPTISNAAEIRIGVRAHNGEERALAQWQPTANYLSKKIPEHTFVMVPFIYLSELKYATKHNEIDFVLTHPSSYIEMEVLFGISRMLTLKNRRAGGAYKRFGSVIFTRSDRDDINFLHDLKGKTFMGVAPEAFGGWQIPWYEFLKNGINPYKDFKHLYFSGSIQQDVVYAVANGEVDAGAVRTDMLERMAAANKISLSDFRVLGAKRTEGFPFYHSTDLYPEWPFAKLKNTSDELAQKVAIALLAVPPESPASIAGLYVGWTVPLDYQPVHDMLKELKVRPYEQYGEVTPLLILKRYWHWIIAIAITFLSAIATSYVILIANKKLRIIRNNLESEITERKIAEKKLNHYREHLENLVQKRTSALEASNKELEAFSYSIAHDLRSPLRSVTSFSQILLEDLKSKLNEEEKDLLNRVIYGGKYMAHMIDDILDLSLITRSELHKNTVDLSLIAHDIIHRLNGVEHPKVEWVIQGDMTEYGDPRLMENMLSNLLENAWKYSSMTDHPRIEFGLSQYSDSKTYFVKDNGVGFDMRFVNKLFKTFSRLHRNTEFEGTGIGLATVKRIIERHGGRIWVDSEPGKGSTFYFTLGGAEA